MADRGCEEAGFSGEKEWLNGTENQEGRNGPDGTENGRGKCPGFQQFLQTPVCREQHNLDWTFCENRLKYR